MDFSTGPSTKLPVIADLGMPANAAETLDELPKELHSHPEVLATRFAVLKASGKWAEAAGVARGLTDFMGEEPQHWIWWAHATRRAESVEAAAAILEDAAEHHPDTAVISRPRSVQKLESSISCRVPVVVAKQTPKPLAAVHLPFLHRSEQPAR